MTVKLGVLSTGTIFKYEGTEYQKSSSMVWSPVGANLTESDYHGPKDPCCSIIKCAPKLGGEFQPELEEWFNKNTIVSVN